MPNANHREIERKYLLRELPARVGDAPSMELDQGYLPGDRINERVRRVRSAAGVRYYRTIKAGSGIERFEVEEVTSELFFTTVWPLTRGHRIQKRRYLVPSDGVTWEIDEFLDREGLWLAEIELERADDVVVPPEWLRRAIDREVTEDPRYTNHALAR
jgi:CYTH domain-containing protein